MSVGATTMQPHPPSTATSSLSSSDITLTAFGEMNWMCCYHSSCKNDNLRPLLQLQSPPPRHRHFCTTSVDFNPRSFLSLSIRGCSRLLWPLSLSRWMTFCHANEIEGLPTSDYLTNGFNANIPSILSLHGVGQTILGA